MENNFKKIKTTGTETMVDLYNKYGLIREGVSEEGGKIMLSNKLIDEGWKVGLSFRDTDDHVKHVLEEINSKKLLYEIKIAFVKDEPFSHIRCLLLKDKKLI